MKKYLPVLLYLWLYIGWFACVFLGKWNLAPVSLLVPVIGWLLFWKALSPTPRDCGKVFALCLLGMLVDAAFAKWGVVRFTTPVETGVLPVWMISLWLLFAPAIYVFAGVFRGRLPLAALAGAILGPLSYKSGEAFGVLEMRSFDALLFYALFWAAFMPRAVAWVRRAPA